MQDEEASLLSGNDDHLAAQRLERLAGGGEIARFGDGTRRYGEVIAVELCGLGGQLAGFLPGCRQVIRHQRCRHFFIRREQRSRLSWAGDQGRNGGGDEGCEDQTQGFHVHG